MRNDDRFTIIGVNNKMLKDCVNSEEETIPNRDFLISLCKYHNAYNNQTVNGTISQKMTINSSEIISTVSQKTGDVVDEVMPNPDFMKLKPYMYQNRSINWMKKREEQGVTIKFNINDEIVFGNGDVYYDALKQNFTTGGDRKSVTFNGGALIDEVGLGKTLQMITLSLSNQATDLSYIRKGSSKFHSRAT